MTDRLREGNALVELQAQDCRMGIREIMSVGWAQVMAFGSYADLLRKHGVDLSHADPEQLVFERGTPVYVEDGADSMMVLRRMALVQVRLVFVLENENVLGAIDLAELPSVDGGPASTLAHIAMAGTGSSTG